MLIHKFRNYFRKRHFFLFFCFFFKPSIQFLLIFLYTKKKKEEKNVNFYRNLDFEKAYCLYRLNQVPEALKVVEGVQNPSLKIKELKAQILYRLEKYEDCFAVYRDIIKNTNDDYEDERETNLAAVLSNLAAEGSVKLFNSLTSFFFFQFYHP